MHACILCIMCWHDAKTCSFSFIQKVSVFCLSHTHSSAVQRLRPQPLKSHEPSSFLKKGDRFHHRVVSADYAGMTTDYVMHHRDCELRVCVKECVHAHTRVSDFGGHALMHAFITIYLIIMILFHLLPLTFSLLPFSRSVSACTVSQQHAHTHPHAHTSTHTCTHTLACIQKAPFGFNSIGCGGDP